MRSDFSLNNNNNYARIPKIKQGSLLSLYIVYMQYIWTISKARDQGYNNSIIVVDVCLPFLCANAS